jgi:hypothetical protein
MATASKVVRAEHGVREGRLYEWGISVVKMGVVDVSFGASENYATGGIDIATPIRSLFPDVQDILGVTVLGHNAGGWVPRYDVSTGRLLFYGQEPTNTTTGVIALSEMPNNSNAINGRTVRVLFFGV